MMLGMNVSSDRTFPIAPAPKTAISGCAGFPHLLLADDATSADQMALSVCEAMGARVVTTDAQAPGQRDLPAHADAVWIINSETRAMSEENARARNRDLITRILSKEKRLPLLQIDSRLRGIRNALAGIYDALDFECLLFVPAEPELGRLVTGGTYYHLEEGQPTPFHQSLLAGSAEPRFATSDLRAFIEGELGVSAEKVVSIPRETVESGPDAITRSIRGSKQQGKVIVIPDMATPEHVEAVIAAWKALEQDRVLLAGSRTFLRSLFASFATGKAGGHQAPMLSQAIDRARRGAPLAIIASLEPAMGAQIAYAQRALGPNLVTLVFDSSALLKEEEVVQSEIHRLQQLLLEFLRAGRPVLLHTSRTPVSTDPGVCRKQLDALSRVAARDGVHRHVSALFVSGGQAAEVIRNALGISTVEIKGTFQAGAPWGQPLEGAFRGVPLVTKGGRLGAESVLCEFFEQAHPLPRANILPVVTPLTKERQVDEDGIKRLVNHLVRLGTTDLFAVGNAGEFRFLTNAQRLKALELFAKHAQGKLRLFAGITGETADETRNNYREASKLGVAAAVVMPLYFLERSDEIAPFIKSLGTIQPGVPVILYNNPERTKGQHISFEAAEALEYPVVAIKDSSGDKARFDRYLGYMPVYEGQQRQFLEGYQHGARGAIGIIGHVSALPNEFFAPATTEARREEIAGEINNLSKEVKQGGAEVAAYKFWLSLMGVMGDTVASTEPARELTAAQRDQIRTRFCKQP